MSEDPIPSNQMMSQDLVSLFPRVPTDETQTVVQNKLVADPSLDEHTCIPIDNLIEKLTFCGETTYLGLGQTYTDKKEDWLWPQYWSTDS